MRIVVAGTISAFASFPLERIGGRQIMAEREPQYGETSSLIASNMVEGTAVYNAHGEKMGKIMNFMVNKHSGQVEYAVMSFGGFLGMGEDHYPLPWKKLKYVVEHHGFVVDLSKEQLEKAPKHERPTYPVYDQEYAMMINSYYGIGR
jgi:sporulation protein YlmC with PRC-barrel domain